MRAVEAVGEECVLVEYSFGEGRRKRSALHHRWVKQFNHLALDKTQYNCDQKRTVRQAISQADNRVVHLRFSLELSNNKRSVRNARLLYANRDSKRFLPDFSKIIEGACRSFGPSKYYASTAEKDIPGRGDSGKIASLLTQNT